ncbi:MAG: TolC family protein [Treponema sp.]|jgi:outer membrane protein TolC|nr:TolC family protein [Treponema sp.]
MGITIKRKLWAGILLGVFIGFCGANEGMGLEELRDLALSHARGLTRLNLAVENAMLEEKTRQFGSLPSLSLGAQGSMNLGGETTMAERFAAGASFGVSQTLWDRGKNGVLKAINGTSLEISRQDALAEYYAVLAGTDAAYYGVLEAAASLETADTALEAADLAFSMAELRLENGMISRGDYLQALAEREAKGTARNQARRDLTLAEARLKNLTGLGEIPPLAPVDFAAYDGVIQRLWGLSEPAIDGLYLSLKAAALANNPSLVKAELQNRQAEQAVTLAKRDYLPSLSASVSAGLNYSPLQGFETSPGRFTLSGSIPLDFWVTGNNVEKKKIAQTQAGLAYLNAGAELDLSIQTALLDWISQAGSVISSRRADEYARQHYEYVLELYRLSQSSLSALSDAAALAGSSRIQRIKAQYGFLSCLSQLRSLGCFNSEEELLGYLP